MQNPEGNDNGGALGRSNVGSGGEDGNHNSRRNSKEGAYGGIESKKAYDLTNSKSVIPLSAVHGHIRITSITSCYKIGPRIGVRGAYGEVRKAVGVSATAIQAVSVANAEIGGDSTDNHVAIKILKKPTPSLPLSITSDSKSQSFYREVRILKSLNHPKIVKFVDAYEDELRYYLVMELCQGGDLYEYLEQRGGRISESEARSIMRQLIASVEYLHDRGVTHCDIKPNNVMFASASNHSSLRLIDFGLAQTNDAGSTQIFTERTGTTGFMAPEILYENYSEKCDVWSLGVLLFVMLYGYNPFDPYNKLSVDSIERRVLKGFLNKVDQGFGAWFPESLTTTCGISEEARDLIVQMLAKDVTIRPSVYELLDHPFFDVL
jgi:serine/threonine protein kinase